ncbi:MAG: GGDEF domain-containing protein [Sulfurimonas sp.]|nr:GGDEF domain-containing protein [Sulfurimonas sp.]
MAGSLYGVVYSIASLLVILLENYFFDLGLSELAINSAVLGLVIGSLLSFIYTNKITEYQSILYKKNENLKLLSSTDFLTGLMNKRLFDKTISEYFLNFQVSQKSFALLVLDLDHLKKINDKYGRPSGDEILISFTYIIKLLLKQKDVFARIGGEEFAILLQDTNKKDAIRVAQMICQEVARKEVYITSDSITIRTSIGLAMIDSKDTHVSEIFKRADKALYKAKDEGRNKVCI